METREYLTFVGKLKGLSGSALAARVDRGFRALRHRRCLEQTDRQALQRLPAARRARAGHHPQPRRPDPRRAHRRPRSQADQRDPRADSQPGRRSHHYPEHPHPARSGADLRAGDHHQQRQAGRHRLGAEPAEPRARRRVHRARSGRPHRSARFIRHPAAPGKGLRRQPRRIQRDTSTIDRSSKSKA